MMIIGCVDVRVNWIVFWGQAGDRETPKYCLQVT